MDSLPTNNVNSNGNKPSLHKSRSNASFGQAAVTKSDVGDFQEGYFVMAEMPPLPQQRNKTNRTPERNQRKNEHSNHRQQQPSTKEIEQLLQRDSDTNVSSGRLTTSPNRSPTRNHKRTSPQRIQTTTDPSISAIPSSPHKPRKANSQTYIHHEKRVERSESSPSFSPESNSPPKTNRWAGPAFSNAPPPSSLPIPDFPPFETDSSSPLSTSPSSPPLPAPTFVASQQPILMYEPPQYVYAPVAYGYPLHLAYEISQPPTLAQLSTDLRKMLNIGSQPITA